MELMDQIRAGYDTLASSQLEELKKDYESRLSEAKGRAETSKQEVVQKAVTSKIQEIRSEQEKLRGENKALSKVCRYRLQEQAKSICEVCKISEDLSMCLCCGFVGCARCKGGRAIGHLKETQHSFSFELETQGIWHYVGEDYMFQLIQSKVDKEFVRLISHLHDRRRRCNFFGSQLDEALRRRTEIAKEWKKQLEDKKLHYECELQKFQEETERQTSDSEAVEMAVAANVEVQEEQAKLDGCRKKGRDLEEINKQLLQKQKLLEAERSEAEESKGDALRAKDKIIRQLKKKVRGLMLGLDLGS